MEATSIEVKRVRVVCSTPLTDVEVEIQPSDTAADVLTKAGLDVNRTLLMRPGDRQDFGLTEPVFDQVAANSKLHAVPDCMVGACVVYNTCERRGQPPPSPVYAEQVGWRFKESFGKRQVFEGPYRTRYGLRWKGRVIMESGARHFLIFKPPIEVLDTIEERACFHDADQGWWLVGFVPEEVPSDLSSGVHAIELTLNKAYREYFQKRRRRVS